MVAAVDGDAAPASGESRSFLFLQGPASNFFEDLAKALLASGHRVHRINLHLGDRLFWHLPATNFRGAPRDWRQCVAAVMTAHQTTDLILLGDRRPYHLVAAEEARARGIAVHCIELGYLRPDWLTLEPDGMSSYSRFPRDPAAIRALATRFPEPDLTPRFHTSFARLAALDLTYNLAEVFGRPLYAGYRRHAIFHPLAEYAGWAAVLLRQAIAGRLRAARQSALAVDAGSYFLFPLQLATDYQIRAHSPYAVLDEAIHDVLCSFATAAPGDATLAVVVHPLDNGLIAWKRRIMRLARRLRIADRVTVFHGGVTAALLRNAAGVVTVNSTLGLSAVQSGVPVKVLGNAVFDVPGLTCQEPLAHFWREPTRPDAALAADFTRALAGALQIRGGFYERNARAEAVTAMAARLRDGSFPLPPLTAAKLEARTLRHRPERVVALAVADDLGLALARAFAAPGVLLLLVAPDSQRLATAAEDCRRRGAAVEAVQIDLRHAGTAVPWLAAADSRMPVDLFFADAAHRLIISAAAAQMRQRRSGHIVLFSAGDDRAVARSLRADGIVVTVVRRRPGLCFRRTGDDRRAETVKTGVARRRAAISIPS